MNFSLTPEMVATIYQHTVLAVSILLAGGGIGFAIGSGIVCGDTIECMVRQPDTRPTLMLDTFIFTGLVGNFPFIILAFGAWFLFANPFVDTLKSELLMASKDNAMTVGVKVPKTAQPSKQSTPVTIVASKPPLQASKPPVAQPAADVKH